jgi:GPH family glycoside/pentoside/hexuronide:cation symporter
VHNPMSHAKTPIKDKVPLVQKAAYGSGTLTLNLLPAALGVFSAFLIIEFGMDPLLAGLLGALPRFLDAITDPIMGFITDNTRSRWGRRRPYVFIGAILSGIIFALLWQLDSGNSQTYNFVYFLLLSFLFTLGNTMYATPLVGLGYELTSDYNERTHLMAVSQFAGQFAWMFVPWLWVLVANENWFGSVAEGVRHMAIYVAITCTVMGIFPAIFCKGIASSHIENTKEISIKELKNNVLEVFKGIAQAFRNVPFVRLCASTFLIFNGFQLVASFAFFIILYHMFGGNYGAAGHWPAWFGSISAVVTAFLVIPIVSWMADRLGKRNAFIIATCLSIVGYTLKWWGFNPDNPWLMFMPIPLISFGIGGLFTLMMSMTADVCDLDELRNGMPRKEGTFGAIYWLMVKLGQALAIFLGGLVLKLVGFEGGAETQSVQTMTNLRIADIIIPATTAGIAIFVMLGYDITEARAREIKAQLVARRGEL